MYLFLLFDFEYPIHLHRLKHFRARYQWRQSCMNWFDLIAWPSLAEVLSVSQITTTDVITHTGGKTTRVFFEKRTYTEAFTTPPLGALSYAFSKPPPPLVLSRWPPCNNVIPSTFSIFTVLKQQNVYFEMRTYVAGNNSSLHRALL